VTDTGLKTLACPHGGDRDSCVTCLRAEVCRLRADDWQMTRLLAWIKDAERQPSQLAFTSGPTREAAYWFETLAAENAGLRDKADNLQAGFDTSQDALAAEMERSGELAAENAELRDALLRIGLLTRWVGWLERGHAGGAAKDVREIQRIAREATGHSFEEYT
jgi:hypothetical protein